MPIYYKVIPRKNPSDRSLPEKYYPSFVPQGRVSMRKMSTQISRISAISPADVYAVLEMFQTLVPESLADGYITEMGVLGSFSLRLHGEGADTPEEVTESNIKGTYVRYYPSKQFKNVIKAASYSKIKT